jgi:hypothetical protein
MCLHGLAAIGTFLRESRIGTAQPWLSQPLWCMSALGYKQTLAPQKAMSALPSKDMCGAIRDVRFGPIGDIGSLNPTKGVGVASYESRQRSY